jgi:hypothetical protein
LSRPRPGGRGPTVTSIAQAANFTIELTASDADSDPIRLDVADGQYVGGAEP